MYRSGWLSRSIGLVVVFGVATLSGCDPYPGCLPPSFCDSRLHDLDDKSQDLGRYLAVETADEFASGNAIAGTSGATGKLGRVSLSIRGTAVKREVPRLDRGAIAVDGSFNPTAFGAASTTIVVPSIDGALGLWRGVPA